MVDNEAHLKKLCDSNITLFATTTQENLAGISSVLAAQVNFVPLDAVPHTNTPAACEAEYKTFKDAISGRTAHEYKRVTEGKDPFAFVVLNAGFKVGKSKLHLAWAKASIRKHQIPWLKIDKDQRHFPYKIKEAVEHGTALGNEFSAPTNLILAHGGPRNLTDDRRGRRSRMEAFAQAYSQAQFEKFGVRPKIIREHFKPGLPYNILKVGDYLARARDNCVAFISNSEGYSTMDGAVLNISNQNKLLGMFPFGAQYADKTGQRQGNIEKYNQLGVAVLTAQDGILSISKHPQQKTTPAKAEDAAQKIIQSLELAHVPAQVSKKNALTRRI